MEQTYRDISLIGAASLLAVSTAFLASFSFPGVLLYLSMPVVFGITSYLSRDGFNSSSLAALVALPFAVLGSDMLLFALVLSLGNVLVSFFAGGDRLRDHYRATKFPMILMGLMVGIGMFGAAMSNQDFQDEIRETAAQEFAQRANSAVQDMNLVENRKQQQAVLVQTVSAQTVVRTQNYVLEELGSNISERGLILMQGVFNQARTEIPEELTNETVENMQQSQTNLTESMSQMFRQQLSSERMVVLVGISLLIALLIQPVFGMIAAATAGLAGRIAPEPEPEPDLFD